MHSPFLLPVLAVTLFFTGVTEFMISPMLTPLAAAFSVTPAQASHLVAVYTLTYALAAPVAGWVSDRVDRRRLLRLALLLFTADGIALSLAPDFTVALALRILGGLASAMLIPTVFALIAEQFPAEKQPAAMSSAMTGMTLGIVAGPVMAGWLTAHCGWSAPFLFTAAGSFLMWGICGVLFAGIVPPAAGPFTGHGQTGGKGAPARGLMLFILAKGIWNGSAVTLFVLSGELLRAAYGLSDTATGLVSGVFGCGLLAGNTGLSWLTERCRSPLRLLLISLTVMIAAVTGFISHTGGLPGSLICLAVWGAALGVAAPVSTSLIAAAAGNRAGTMLARSESLNNLSVFVLLPLCASLLISPGSFT